MATPFSEAAVDMLERVGVDAYKIASGDLTCDALIAAPAPRTGRSSSRPAWRRSTRRSAPWSGRRAPGRRVALLHCVSAYPVPDGQREPARDRDARQACHVPVGLSDHGADAFAVPLAVALGASLYERHLMLAADDDGVDAAVSSTPGELAAVVRAAARAADALGAGAEVCLPAEAVNLAASRRGLYARGRCRPATSSTPTTSSRCGRPSGSAPSGSASSSACACPAPSRPARRSCQPIWPHAKGTEHVA